MKISYKNNFYQRIRAIERTRDNIIKARREGRSICHVSKIGSIALRGRTRKKVAFLSALFKNKKIKCKCFYFAPCALYTPKWRKELRKLDRKSHNE